MAPEPTDREVLAELDFDALRARFVDEGFRVEEFPAATVWR